MPVITGYLKFNIFNIQHLVYLSVCLFMALGISLCVVQVIRVAHSLKLLDNPNGRSAANKPILTLGRISVFRCQPGYILVMFDCV